MPRRVRLKTPAYWLILLFILTAGFGLFVPSIEGLGSCEFQIGRLFLAVGIWLTVVPFLVVCFAVGGKWRFRLGLLAVWPLAVLINMGLGHDPICAAVNWEIRLTDFEQTVSYREWGVVTWIENHEHVHYDPDTEVYSVRGPGLD